tara:strand:- start:262 stop:537 length:276 start_codon:yes stop_codon:yes gene_type:complete
MKITMKENSMPYYDYSCSKCSTEEEYNVKIADRDCSIDCPVCDGKMERMLSLPNVGYDSFTLTGRKPDEGLRDRLREIKKNVPNNNFNHLI